MLNEENKVKELVIESMDVTSKVLLRELSGECTTEEAVETYRTFLSRVKDFALAPIKRTTQKCGIIEAHRRRPQNGKEERVQP